MLASLSSSETHGAQPRADMRPAYRVAVLALLVIIAAEITLSTRQQSQTFAIAS